MNSESYNDGGSEISEYKISSMCKNTASSSVIPIRFSKMNSQPFTRRIFTLCGVCAPPEGSNFQAKFRQIITVLFISVNIQVMELGFILYGLYQLEIGNVFNLLFAVLHVAASNAARLSYITVIPQSKKCRDLFNGLQTISNMCEHSPLARNLYLRTNELCDKILKWALIIQAFFYVSPAISLLVGGAIFYYIHDGHVEPKNLYMPLKTRTPFDGNTFFGFCFTFYINYVGALAYLLTATLIPSLFLTMGLFFNTFREHFELMFQNMSDLIVKNRWPDYAIRVKLCLIEAIKFHNQAKDLFELSKKTMSGSVFFELILGVLVISTTNFELELVMKSMNYNIFLLLQSVPLGTGFVFLICSVGSYTTDNFSRYGDVSYESLWYEFPTELQKYLLLIITNAQRPQIFQGFGIIDLNLMAFTKVLKTVASYYLMFKNFAK